jgi:trk system potassium uptake protein TrkA
MLIGIVGADRVGTQLAKKLIEQNQDVIVLEKNSDRASAAADTLDGLVVHGDGTNLDDLKKSGIAKADYFISVTGSDERNMIACGLADREFNIPQKIARVQNINFSNTNLLEKSFLGIDYIVNPSMEAAKNIISSIEHGAVSDIMLFENTGLQMRNLAVSSGSLFENKKVSEIPHLFEDKFLISVILRNNQYIIPAGDTIIREMDNLYVVGTQDALDNIFSKVGKVRIDFNKIVVIGGSDIGQFVVKYFLTEESENNNVFNKFTDFFSKIMKKKKNISIIERDYEVCKALSEKFPDLNVIHADVSDEGILEDEGLTDADLIISCTYNQELNIVTSVYAKSLGIKRSVSLVNKTSYLNVASNLGIDVPISLNNSMIVGIQRFIKRDKIQSFHSISSSNIEVIQLMVSPESRISGKKISEIKFPHHSLILSVKNGDKDILPNGEHVIKGNDTVIMIARKESIEKIETMFTS